MERNLSNVFFKCGLTYLKARSDKVQDNTKTVFVGFKTEKFETFIN